MDNLDKADTMVKKMESKLSSFSIFSTQTAKLEEAEEVFQKAANLYKMAKKWDEAGRTFRKLADVQLKLGNKFQAATSYNDAANCFKKCSTEDTAKCLRDATDIFTDMGKFANAAKTQNELGELLENEGDKEGAIKAYETAADYYSGENSASQANSARLKAATLYALLEKYTEATEIFEQVGIQSADSSLMKWNAKDYFFKAALCRFCTGDIVQVERSLDQYCSYDVTFNSQREYKLLVAILEASKNFEVDDFTAAVAEFDSISKLDAWKTTILLRIKNSMKSGQGGGIL
eukprot:c7134_g1_i1.p2 GENE.c7134_g1_i1~~c7134_g1_i1.p2  ORF type:complete len:310 (+),score=66.05 c7134_g1_i1:62-931(+)